MIELKKLWALIGVSTFALMIAGNGLTWAQDNPLPLPDEQVDVTDEEQKTNQEDEVLDAVISYFDADKVAMYLSPASFVYLSSQHLDRYGRLSAADTLNHSGCWGW